MTAGTSVKLFFMQNRMDRFGRYVGREDGRDERFTWKRSRLVIAAMGLEHSSVLGIVDFERAIRALIISSSSSSWASFSALSSSVVIDMIADAKMERCIHNRDGMEIQVLRKYMTHTHR